MCALRPSARAEKKRLSNLRANAFFTLNEFSRSTNATCPVKNVLVDGMWYNPNYWARYAIFRKAMNLSQAKETGIIGPYAREESIQSLNAFGITNHLDLHQSVAHSRYLAQAKKMIKEIKKPSDILCCHLPHNFPGDALYDGILKRQRRATVKLDDPQLAQYFAECLAYLACSYEFIKDSNYDLLIVSHALDYTYLALVWIALKHEIPVIVLYGDYGTSRFIRFDKPQDIYAYPNRPTQEEMALMSEDGKKSLASAGAAYLQGRMTGNTDDVGAIYAYQLRTSSIDHDSMCAHFGWDPQKPIIGVYASNWFDFPHATKMSYFTDFLDWINLTLEHAIQKTDVNWLFKSHPCDDWYATIRGSRVEDLVREVKQPHIRAADKSWNGFNLIQSLDGIVTCHGTIGLEATHFKTPVLISHPGWYGHAGFTKVSHSREEYSNNLTKNWWVEMDTERNSKAADQFTGWYFAVPDWNKSYIFQDDSNQDKILDGICMFFDHHAQSIEHEITEIQAWFEARTKYYHIFKMSRHEIFSLPVPPSKVTGGN